MVRKTIHISNIQSQWLDDQCYNTSSLVRKLLDSYRSSVLDKVSDDKITKYTEQGREFRVPSVVNSTKLNRSYCTVDNKGKSRCPCCNILVRTTARRKHGGETKKLYESAKQ